MIRKILIVDDQTSILSGMSRALHNYCDFQGEIIAVESGKKALGEISSGSYDICFLDLNLPDMSGLDVMEQIHLMSPKTKVVIMTAECLDDDIMEKIEGGAYMFIPKPIELDIVKAFINRESSSDGHYKYKKEKTVYNIFSEKRESERRPDVRTISYSLSVFYNWELKSSLEGAMIDQSTDGAGLITSYPVYPGNVLRFDSSLENKSGIVKWSMKKENKFWAGIRFI